MSTKKRKTEKKAEESKKKKEIVVKDDRILSKKIKLLEEKIKEDHSTQELKMARLLTLPSDLLSWIMSFLSPTAHFSVLPLVCKQIYHSLQEQDFALVSFDIGSEDLPYHLYEKMIERVKFLEYHAYSIVEIDEINGPLRKLSGSIAIVDDLDKFSDTLEVLTLFYPADELTAYPTLPNLVELCLVEISSGLPKRFPQFIDGLSKLQKLSLHAPGNRDIGYLHFDEDVWKKTVVSISKRKLHTLSLGSFSASQFIFEHISKIDSLTSLELKNVSHLTDDHLKLFSNCTRLKSLKLYRCSTVTGGFLSSFSELETLSLQSTYLSKLDFSFIPKLKHLELPLDRMELKVWYPPTPAKVLDSLIDTSVDFDIGYPDYFQIPNSIAKRFEFGMKFIMDEIKHFFSYPLKKLHCLEIDDQELEVICCSFALEHLILNSERLTNMGLKPLLKLKSLKYLHITRECKGINEHGIATQLADIHLEELQLRIPLGDSVLELLQLDHVERIVLSTGYSDYISQARALGKDWRVCAEFPP